MMNQGSTQGIHSSNSSPIGFYTFKIWMMNIILGMEIPIEEYLGPYAFHENILILLKNIIFVTKVP